ncbi:MAG: thiol reductase thioredoxin [Candidatus Hydrogenedentes bacterium]|nr:thiol reductase thioredoxin [Candidatus Hydrogenedentota bacterium]
MDRILKNSKPLQVNSTNFDLEVLQSEQPVLVAFSTEWSRPCHILDPVLDEIATSCAETLKVVRVNADGNPDLGTLYDIRAVPTLLFFVDGCVRGKVVGTASKAAILSKFAGLTDAEANSRRHPNA